MIHFESSKASLNIFVGNSNRASKTSGGKGI